jgi:phage terminase large subunit
MAGEPLVQASAEKLQMLARLRAEKARVDSAKLADLDVFKLIGYEPNCKRRHVARERIAAGLGITDPYDYRVDEYGGIPEYCGKCPQELFHSATEDDVLYGGASGGGKSFAITAEGIKWCARYPGLRVLLIRKSYDELEESIFPALRKFSYGQILGCRWNGVKFELRFTNGSYFRFRYLETKDDAARRQGGEYQLLLVDELALMLPGVVDILRYERLRSAGGLPVIGVRCTSNPGGPSHGEVKKRYVDATDNGAKVVRGEDGLTVRFIKARASDNFRLDAMQKHRLDAIPDPNRRAAMRDGDWGTFSGAVFPQFSKERHTVEPRRLPASWNRYNGLDWGYAAPWAVLWGAVDEDKRLWIYRELYQTHTGEADQARMILAAEDGEHIIARWADDAVFSARGDAKAISEVYAENGVHLTPAGKGPGSRITGLQRWHSYMADGPACPHHRALGQDSCPLVHIFYPNCRNLVAELESLPYATSGNVEDADTKAPDHAYDAGRYLLLNLDGGAQFYDAPAPGLPLGAPAPLAPMGRFAVAEVPGEAPVRAPGSEPNPQQGATQTWEEALAAMRN